MLTRYRDLLMKNRGFRNLCLGQTLSYTGNAIYDITLMWFVFAKTGSAVQVSLVLVASFLPEMIFGMLFGALTDRSHHKRLLQLSDLLSSVVLLLLALSFQFQEFRLWQIYGVTICLSLLGLLFSISQGAWLPELVEREHLMTANALMTTSRQMTRLIGSAIGGALVAMIGSTTAIEYDALTFLGSMLLIQTIPYRLLVKQQNGSAKKRSLFADIREGIGWLTRQRALLLMVIIGTLSNVALGPTNVLPTVYIQAELHANATALGFFDAAIGLGIVLGSLFIGYLSPKKVGLWFAAGLSLQGLSMLLVANAWDLVVACLGNFVLGIAVIMTGLPMGTLFQVLTPTDKRGRVNSIVSMGFSLSIPITYGGIGLLSSSIGSRGCYTWGAFLLFACGLVASLSVQVRSSNLASVEKNKESVANL